MAGPDTAAVAASRGAARHLQEYRAKFDGTDRLAITLVFELDREVIGDMMLKVKDGWAQNAMEDQARDLEAELGWCLDPRYSGSGYATEAVEAAGRRVRSRIADGLSDHASGPGTRAHQRRKTAPTAPPITSSSATRTSAGIPSRTIPTPAALSAEGSLEVTIAVTYQKRRTPAPAGADVATVRQDRSLPRTAPQASVDGPCQHASCTHLPARDQRT